MINGTNESDCNIKTGHKHNIKHQLNKHICIEIFILNIIKYKLLKS